MSAGIRAIVRTFGMTPPQAQAHLEITRQKRSAGEALHANAEPFVGAFEHAPIGMALLAPDGRTLRVNHALCEMLGYSEAELVSGTVRGLTYPEEDAAGQARLQRLVNGEIGPYQIEKRYIAREGHVLWTLTSLSLIRDGTGAARFVVVHVQDISKRKEMETILHDREQRLRVFLEQVPAVLWTTDRDLRFTSGRGRGLVELGLQPDQLVGTTIAEYLQTDDADPLPVVAHRAALRGQSMSYEAEAQGHSFQCHVGPFRDADGRIIGTIGLAMDVTEQRQAEAARRESEARFTNAFEHAPVGIAISDPDGHPLRVNQALCEMLGYSEEELRLKSAAELTHPADRDLSIEPRRRLVAGEIGRYHVEKRYLHRLGHPVWVSQSVSAVRNSSGRALYLIAQIQDVTERRRMMEALQESEAKFRTLAETAGAAIFIFQGSRLRYVNPAAEAITGQSRAALLGGGFWHVEPHFYPVADDAGIATEKATRHRIRYELRLRHRSGEFRWLDFTASVTEFEGRRAVIGTAFDITQRKRDEHALREQAYIIDQVHDAVIGADLAGSITLWNRGAEHLFGFRADEALGKHMWRLCSEERREILEREVVLPLRQRGSHEVEIELRRKSGEMFPAHLSMTLLTDDRGVPSRLIGYCIDMTERNRVEEAMRQHQAQLAHVSRVSALGQMAAGLAHELNQPLTAIINYTRGCAHRMRSRSERTAKLREAMEQAAVQAERAADIIRSLRTMIGKGEPRRDWEDVNALVHEVLPFAEAETHPHAVAVRLELTPHLPRVQVDGIQIEQVILNLVRNAADAMRETALERRELTIRTAESAGHRVEIAVRDAGHGLPPEIARDVFEPFFTTKSNGLGMGLSISRSIIEAHGGNLWATANADGGATFHFTLPAGEGERDATP